jgi:hypothetical protein
VVFLSTSKNARIASFQISSNSLFILTLIIHSMS